MERILEFHGALRYSTAYFVRHEDKQILLIWVLGIFRRDPKLGGTRFSARAHIIIIKERAPEPTTTHIRYMAPPHGDPVLQQRRAWMRILDRVFIDRNARAADRVCVDDFRYACAHSARIIKRLDALRASGMPLPAPQSLPAPLRGFGPFRAYYAAWCAARS